MRPLLFKNLFVAFLTGLLVIAGVLYAYYITSSPLGNEANKISFYKFLPVYSGQNISHPTYSSSSDFKKSDMSVSFSSANSDLSNLNSYNHTTSGISSSVQTVRKSTSSRLNASNINKQSIVGFKESNQTVRLSLTQNHSIIRNISNNSKSNIPSVKTFSGKSASGSLSLPEADDLASAEFSTSFSASDLSGEPVKQSILPGTGFNPTEADAVPVPGGILVLILFVLIKYLTHDSNYRKFKIFTYFSQQK